MTQKKITSILELGRYKIDQCVYWLIFRDSHERPILSDEDEWMFNCHPMTLYKGPYKKLWDKNIKLPKLHSEDFEMVVSLLSRDLVVEEFIITNIHRSKDTGDFYYQNQLGEWMPQQCLFDTKVAARRECNRISKLISKWAKNFQE